MSVNCASGHWIYWCFMNRVIRFVSNSPKVRFIEHCDLRIWIGALDAKTINLNSTIGIFKSLRNGLSNLLWKFKDNFYATTVISLFGRSFTLAFTFKEIMAIKNVYFHIPRQYFLSLRVSTTFKEWQVFIWLGRLNKRFLFFYMITWGHLFFCPVEIFVGSCVILKEKGMEHCGRAFS